ncbi:hypothetical protein HD554DRAFT_2056457 [Boletus coccyginus]|nr:hypothetical protein HD554DRAFT_2056457 [Boletus coccyginus]
MSQPSIDSGLSIQQDTRDTFDTNLVAFAGFAILIWDHLLTFDDEVELIWKRDKGLLVYLFLVNRYLTPLGFIVNLVAFLLPDWGTETCQHFVRYEGAMTVIGTQVAGFMMFLRIRALYYQTKIVIWGIILLFFIWLGINAWLLANGEAVQHVPSVHSCTMIFKSSFSDIASASAWFPLLYDTCIFALVLYKTKYRAGRIVRTLLSDGIAYYTLICMVNIVLTIMIVRAGDGVKNITAQLELLLTVAMMSRITLNLKKQALAEDIILVGSGESASWKPPIWRAWTHSRANTLESTMRSITFRSEPASYFEHVRLSTIYPISMTPEATRTPTVASPVGARLKRPRVEEDVEAM